MSRRSKFTIASFAAFAIFVLFYVHGCEHEENALVSFPAPLGTVEFRSFSVLEWVTSPVQDIKIQLQQQSNVEQLVDLRVFGDFQPNMTDEELIARFGQPSQRWTDNFGGTWSTYRRPFGYVEIGLDRRTSPTDDDKSTVPGRHSLQGFTDKPAEAIFQAPLRDVMRQAVSLTPNADEREISVFDSKHELLLDIWMKRGRIERMELFKALDRSATTPD